MRRSLKVGLAVFLLCLAVGGVAFGGAHFEEMPWLEAFCGVERWSVKTGTDADAGLVELSATSPVTIATATGWPYPTSIPSNNRVAPYETTVWVINATLVEFKSESDEDYHLVLKDSSGRSMIAEIPAPHCVGAGSPFYSGVSNARAEFDAKYSVSGSFKTVNIPVQVTGIGMFDFSHGQTGAAPNQIELHPVIDIVFNPTGGGGGTVPSAPTGLTATPGNAQVSLSWNASSGATSYSLYRATTSGGEASYRTGLTSTTFTDTGLTNGVTYFYKVTASNSVGQSGLSSEASATPSGGITPQQLLGNPGFETGSASPWSASSGVIDSSAGEAAHSGTWKAWLDGYGSAHTDTLYQQVSVPSGASSATLSFWLHVDTAETTTSTAYDTLKVQLRNSGGTVLTTLGTYSNLNKNTGYAQKVFDVSAYRGQTIQVYLIGVEDSSLQTSFVVDDFALNVQ